MKLQDPLRNVKGIGEKTEQLFQNIGVYTVGDILLHFPRTYQEYPEIIHVSQAAVDENVAICGRIKTPAITRKGKRMDFTIASVFDPNGIMVECVWFRMPYISSQLKINEPFVLYGKLIRDGNKIKMEQPLVTSIEKYTQLRKSFQPVYALTKGLTNTMIRKTLQTVFAYMQDEREEEYLPTYVVARENFMSYMESIRQIHFPSDFSMLEKARNRLVYQEFFYFILHSRLQEEKSERMKNARMIESHDVVIDLIEKLPYALTKDQKATVNDILKDFESDYVSQRLVQGDVGCGKTIVAFLAMLDVVSKGYQAAIMAPTEVLARQHFEEFQNLLNRFHLSYEVILLVGSMSTKEKRTAHENIAKNKGVFIVGTHALIQEKVQYHDLALVVTDEQHRFGVKQREFFFSKGNQPHMLVMSATPIPRTLAMILYGNMQISAIKELPANRIPIKTCVITESMRNSAYHMICDEISLGHQAYIICPLVEATETTEAENVSEYVNKVKDILPESIRICGLHGKMSGDEKNRIMTEFANHKIDILVSTTVIEVGVNVPNATVIMIENANRFGLAQLHQLRGRVGRGSFQSYCILMDQSKKKNASKRLEVLLRSNDGFYVAEEDLKLRGPGDFFGIRQSGDLNFRLADIIGDAEYLKMAAKDVDNFLEQEEIWMHYPKMKEQMDSYMLDNNYIL